MNSIKMGIQMLQEKYKYLIIVFMYNKWIYVAYLFPFAHKGNVGKCLMSFQARRQNLLD